MAILQGTLPGTSFTPPAKVAPDRIEGIGAPGSPGDQDSSQAHRQLIGSVGLLLPVLLWLISALRPNDPVHRWETLGSISAYYYTGAVAAFVGLLVALALYLFAYQGFRNKYQRADKFFAKLAGTAAIGVAFFPTTAPTGMQPPWWTPQTSLAHYVCTVALFAVFAIFSLWLFRLTDPEGRPRDPDKTWRNNVYLACGVVIVLGMVWAYVAGAILKQPIFVPESVVLVAFATSWLVKGSIHKVIMEAIKRKA
jgi:hypothetical protein